MQRAGARPRVYYGQCHAPGAPQTVPALHCPGAPHHALKKGPSVSSAYMRACAPRDWALGARRRARHAWLDSLPCFRWNRLSLCLLRPQGALALCACWPLFAWPTLNACWPLTCFPNLLPSALLLGFAGFLAPPSCTPLALSQAWEAVRSLLGGQVSLCWSLLPASFPCPPC